MTIIVWVIMIGFWPRDLCICSGASYGMVNIMVKTVFAKPGGPLIRTL